MLAFARTLPCLKPLPSGSRSGKRPRYPERASAGRLLWIERVRALSLTAKGPRETLRAR